jgi:hypothetical protein
MQPQTQLMLCPQMAQRLDAVEATVRALQAHLEAQPPAGEGMPKPMSLAVIMDTSTSVAGVEHISSWWLLQDIAHKMPAVTFKSQSLKVVCLQWTQAPAQPMRLARQPRQRRQLARGCLAKRREQALLAHHLRQTELSPCSRAVKPTAQQGVNTGNTSSSVPSHLQQKRLVCQQSDAALSSGAEP